MKLTCGAVLKHSFNIACMVFPPIVISGNAMEIYRIDSKSDCRRHNFRIFCACWLLRVCFYKSRRCVYNKVVMKKQTHDVTQLSNSCRNLDSDIVFLSESLLSAEAFAYVDYFNCLFKKYNIFLSMITVHVFHI